MIYSLREKYLKSRGINMSLSKMFPTVVVQNHNQDLGHIQITQVALNGILHSKLCMISERTIIQCKRAEKLVNIKNLDVKTLNRREQSQKSIKKKKMSICRSHHLLDFFLLFFLTFSSDLKYKCLSTSTEEYWGTNLSHCFQIAHAADSKTAEQRAAAALPLLSMWEGVHGALLCVLIH